MLLELVVENYAVVEHVRVRFHPGLNLLTGETGSGKSIVVDALGLLLGGRASAEMVRSGAARARVVGIFDVPRDPAARDLLERAGVVWDEEELLIEREVYAAGKSRAFIQNRPVTTALLRELAACLGDIHGQHDQQQLFDPAAQRDLLDCYAGAGDLAAQTAAAWRLWRASQLALEELDRTVQDKLRLTDLWSFQRQEIESVAPRAGEDAELEAERRRLQNVGRLQENAGAAFSVLYDAPDSALALIRAARRRIEDATRIDERLRDVAATLAPAEVAVQEASYELRDYLARLEADPGRLDQVESRLAAIDKLKRKYGATIDEVLAFLKQVSASLDAVEQSEQRRAALLQERDVRAAAYETLARRLSQARTAAAARLAEQVENELASLAMAGAVFRVQLSESEWTEQGIDTARILVSANRGEEPRPLEKVASGGELSRIALALKTCVAEAGGSRTLVFDEVDAGIGGRAAETVGRKLKQLAAAHQVLCVTHLPQVASFADHHYAVEKQVNNGRTVAVVRELTGDARTREVGRMLSGEQLTPEALKHAEQLIRLSAQGL